MKAIYLPCDSRIILPETETHEWLSEVIVLVWASIPPTETQKSRRSSHAEQNTHTRLVDGKVILGTDSAVKFIFWRNLDLKSAFSTIEGCDESETR